MSKKKNHHPLGITGGMYPISVTGNRILARPFSVETKAGDIFLPEKSQVQSRKAIVLEIGPEGNPDLKPGDVIFTEHARGTDYTVGGEIFRIYEAEDILAKEI